MVSFSHADSVAVHLNNFLLFEWLFAAKVLLKGPAVTQNYVSVVLQSDATKKIQAINWSNMLKSQYS